MLTTKLLSCYNHLLATSMLYLTIIDPIQELSHNLNQHLCSNTNHEHLSTSMVGAAQSEPDQDYYEILGVNKDATKHEIHKAFRQLAKKYHPDKNKDKGAQDEFIKIFKAYETLSDEKKRQEYDNRARSPDHGSSFTNWQANGMNDFNVNDFFKQYEEQLFKHAQYFNHDHIHHNHQRLHEHHHQQFSFHGVNMDDLFHDIDEDEFRSFGRMFSNLADHDQNSHHMNSDIDGHFGDGASFFGSHFSSQIHNTLHQYQHQHGVHNPGSNRYSCHTVTKQVNGIMMTQTSCG